MTYPCTPHITTVNIYCTLHICHQPHSLSCSIILQSPSPVYVHRHRTLFHIYSPPTLDLSNSPKPLDAFIDFLLPICIIMQLPSILTHLRSTHTPIIFSYTNLLQLFQYYITGRSAPSAPTVDPHAIHFYFIISPSIVANVYCLLLRVLLPILRVRSLLCVVARLYVAAVMHHYPIEAVLDLCTKNCG